jgi:DNA primase
VWFIIESDNDTVFRCFDPNCGVQGNVLDLWRAFKKLVLYEAAKDLANTFGIPLPYLTCNTEKLTEKNP